MMDLLIRYVHTLDSLVIELVVLLSTILSGYQFIRHKLKR
jgi:hypothetical protein